jgi:hypothetical protein
MSRRTKESKFFIDDLSSKILEERGTLLSERLQTSDAELKRRTKNFFINRDSVKENFKHLNNWLNDDQKKDNIAYLVKGSSAWNANFVHGVNNGVSDDMKRDLSNHIAFLPQNYDIEIYCPKDKIAEIIKEYYNRLVVYQNSYFGYIPLPSETEKIVTRGQAKKQKEQYGLPDVDTCIAISKNIILKNNKNEIDKECNIIPKIEADEIILKNVIGMENFKAYSLSFCVKLKDEEYEKFDKKGIDKLKEAWRKYSDKDACSKKENFHFIFYITFHEVPKDLWQTFKNDYYKEITTTINGTNYLNIYGLLYYANILRASVSSGFRSEKGLDIDTFRMDKLFDVLTNINKENKEQVQIRKQRIIDWEFRLYGFINEFFGKNIDIWNTHLLPSKFWLKNLNQAIVKKMMENYISESVPNGIIQRFDDIIIDFYRPILNAIIIDLNNQINSDTDDFKTKFPNWLVKIMIAGGDAFERYIPTGKIADIDLKVIIKSKLKVHKQSEETELLDYVRTKIFAILSKHICILQSMVRDCGNDDIMFQKAVAQAQDFFSSTCKDTKPVFKICPIYDSNGNEIKSTFRLRNNYVEKDDGTLNFNLISIDYRKNFVVHYQGRNISYTYDLAILDVPFKIYKEFDYERDVDLQTTFSKSVVNKDCYVLPSKPQIVQFKPSELSLSVERGSRTESKLGVEAPTPIQRIQHTNLCNNPDINRKIKPDGLCFFRSILYCMTQLKKEQQNILIQKLNIYLPPNYKINLNEISYNLQVQSSINTKKTCSKIAYAVYNYLQQFYDTNKRLFNEEFRNILISQDYKHYYFIFLENVFQNNLQRYSQGIETGEVIYQNILDANNVPVEWPGQLEVYALQQLLDFIIQTSLYLPSDVDKLVLYVCFNGRNHYEGVYVNNLPSNYSKQGYEIMDKIKAEDVEIKEEEDIDEEDEIDFIEDYNIVGRIERFPQKGESRKRKIPEKDDLIDVFSGLSIKEKEGKEYKIPKFYFDDGDNINGFNIPVASKAFLIGDQKCIYNDRNQLQSRFLASKIEKDLTRYNKLNIVLNDKNVPSLVSLQILNRVDLDYFNYSVTNINNIPINLKKNILAYFIAILKEYHLNKEKAKVKRDFNIFEQYNQEVADTINETIKEEYPFNEISLIDTISEQKYQDIITGRIELAKKSEKIKGFFFGFFNDNKKDQKNEIEEDFEPDFINIDDLDLLI